MKLVPTVLDYVSMALVLLVAVPVIGLVWVTFALDRFWSWISLHLEFRGDKAAFEKYKAGY